MEEDSARSSKRVGRTERIRKQVEMAGQLERGCLKG